MAIIVDNDTRLGVQGLTGSEGRFHGLRNRAYGTNLVAGVTPGKGGQDVEGVPVFDTVADSVRETGANTSLIFVPARFAPDAIYEAVDAGIKTVICTTEHIPFADGSFDCVVTRIAPHHFTAIGEAVGEMTRVTNAELVIEDTLYLSEEHEQAEKLRDPSHVRSYSEDEWRDMLVDAGLEIERVEYFEKTHETDDWLARTDCTGATADRVRELLAPLSDDGGLTWHDTKLILKARKSQK